MKSVLIVDDRADDRELLATLLGHAGYQVRDAATGDEALALARTERPDLIITDILMPSMNGYEFVRRLRGDPEVGATPVVFCTANYVEEEVKRLAEACGVSDFIPKPSDPETIVRTVGEVLGTSRTLPKPLDGTEFDREQLRLLNDKLVEKVGQLEAANVERRALLDQLMKAHDAERRRIANELHDDAIQTVGALAMRLGTLADRVGDRETAAALATLCDDAQAATERLRLLLSDVQPVELGQEDLAPALRAHLVQIENDDGICYELVDRATRRPEQETRTLLYRAGREALANVRKHAAASHVSIVLDEDERGFSLRVHDNGRGFRPEEALRVRPGHLGLPALRESVETAGGWLNVNSRSGSGATVEVWVPELARVLEAAAR